MPALVHLSYLYMYFPFIKTVHMVSTGTFIGLCGHKVRRADPQHAGDVAVAKMRQPSRHRTEVGSKWLVNHLAAEETLRMATLCAAWRKWLLRRQRCGRDGPVSS